MTDEHYTKTFCPECGPNIAIDEDGLCATCGATAVGDGIEKIMVLLNIQEEKLTQIKEVVQECICQNFGSDRILPRDICNKINKILYPVTEGENNESNKTKR